ncbi:MULTISPECIES: MurR/RpiR family transcriptional regulator [Romboutsia]|uniref:HTH-type transcriptional regulator MurR n=1 Tax=Romboutsia hominis TaxID=1507512 RepID=A0A2P2BP81_9FIRM|nr:MULTISPECIES: MurR/RpiR family transcriptional regulator [Romboutsia]MCH1959190.1 MurR/RpiR family transcriptional regulator [Romboutsia hominis]MCH1970090.1 MurR/RpiR family transcriptional regulator [Romboutsia hominis]MDB8790305.1 MurR/RpiR family transcriptional regulator [Romboutsia sp. 1001216sp1]MDB8792261.1 MurR/RpiR family transcriptional regulator [Romboutsia sp. 1001216sp1]MDB8795555.1 MurR/RpiR family transcriptional regulator [Romboutsia sp. 1001216sp1]
MSIINKLDDKNLKFTKSERQIIDYIKNDMENFSYKSISEIAKDNNIGEATITRFAKKIGFSGFQDFKVTLAQEVTNIQNKHIIDSSIDNKEHARETAKKLLHNNIYVLENTAQIINYEDIHKCSKLIREANKVYFVGVGYSGIIAQDINYKFMRIGINCNYFSDSHTILMMSSLMKKGDIIVCVSHTGETEDIVSSVEMAKKNEATVISVTNDKDSKVRSLSDICLSYISNEGVFESGSMYSKLAQMFVLDIIYTQVVKDMGGIAHDNKLKTTEAIKGKYTIYR